MKMVRMTIVDRFTSVGGKVNRRLNCGHTITQPNGGRAHLAKSAECPECTAAVKLDAKFGAPTPAEELNTLLGTPDQTVEVPTFSIPKED